LSFFDTFFGDAKAEESSFNWNTLNAISQLDSIGSNSKTVTQVIFKHSIRCGISKSVLKRFEQKYASEKSTIDFHYLDLITYRAISNEIAQRFEVHHQSPQLLILKDGIVISHASHHAILEVTID